MKNKELSRNKNKEGRSNKASHSGEANERRGSRDVASTSTSTRGSMVDAQSSTDCRRIVAVEGVGSARGGGGGEGWGKEGRKRQKRKVEESSFARSVRQSALKFGNNEEALNIAIRLSQQDVSVFRSAKEEEEEVEDPCKRTSAQTERRSGGQRSGKNAGRG